MASPENEENLEKPGGPRSAVRVMDILYKLSSASGRVSLAELSEGLELPKTSVFSLLRALDKGGYVIQAQGGYELGPEAFKLGAAMVQRRAFPGFLKPTLQRSSWGVSLDGETRSVHGEDIDQEVRSARRH